jgi:hypothetical protein
LVEAAGGAFCVPEAAGGGGVLVEGVDMAPAAGEFGVACAMASPEPRRTTMTADASVDNFRIKHLPQIRR